MYDKLEIGLIKAGEIAMFLGKYADLLENLKKNGIVYSGHDDFERPRKLSEELYENGEKIADELNYEAMYNKAPKFTKEKEAKKFAKEHPEMICALESWDEYDDFGYRGPAERYVFFESLYDFNLHIERFPKMHIGSCSSNLSVQQYSFK